MGLREKVTITLVIIALIQIACRHCMPRTPRKASLKRYLNELKPVKNNPSPAPYSPSRVNKTPKQIFGKKAQNDRISQNSLPEKSLYKTYNFPENEYPLDNFPRDPFRIGMNFNENNHVNTLQKTCNLQSSAISDLKKEMKMKRKLLSNKQVNIENSQLKTDMPSIKSSSNPDPIRLLDSETFPEVQYPLNTMDTWMPNYWNYLPFTQEKPFHRFGQQTFNPNTKGDNNKPFTRLTKAKARKYLQSYDKLKEEHRRTSTENSKRSNVGQKGLNFTKTATCERVSDDFITAGLVSNIPSNSTEMKKALTSSTKIRISSENTCPVTEYPYHPMPIPYKIIEDTTENICPAHDLKNKTKELQDVDNSIIAQTLQLIQEILFNDDTSSTVLPGNYSKEIEKNMNTSDYTVVSANENVSTIVIDSAKNCTESPIEELLKEVCDDTPAGNSRNNMTSLPAELIPENTTTVEGPLNVRMPLPFSEPITYEALTNALNPSPAPLLNSNAVPGSTSIIIIPFNTNAVGKSQSHMFGTSPDTPIIVYLPSAQSSDKPSQPWSFNQIVSSSVDRHVPNNLSYDVLSNTAPLQNDNPFSNVFVTELLNSNSDSGSSLPIHEMLPTNSMCYNNESSPSSMKEKPISDILIDKSLTDDAPFVTTTCDEKLSEQPTETGDLHVNTNTLPPISDVEHPLFDFSGSDFTSLSHGPFNNILHNELPIIAREIDSDQQIVNVSSKDLFIPTQNVTSKYLHKTTSMDSVSEDSLSEIPNDVPPVALDNKFSSVTSTDSIETVKTNTLLPESIPNLQEPVDTLTENLPQPIDKILLSTPLIEPPTAELSQPKESSLSPNILSESLYDKLPIIMDTKLPINTPSPSISNSSPMMTDMTLITELYKIRQILDKMLSTETPTNSQPPPTDTTLLPISDSDSLLLSMNETPTESLPVPAVDNTLLPLPATDSPTDSLRQLHETLPPISVDGTPTDTRPLPGNKLTIRNKLLETDTPLLLKDETVPLPLVSETSADNKPYLLDKLVTPLSETVTSRTKDNPDNGLSHKTDDLPLKMDLKFPDIYEVSSDDLPLLVDDLQTKVYPERTTNPGVSTNHIRTQVVETLTDISEVPVSDLPKPTDVVSLPVDEVLEGASPDVPTNNVKTLISGSIDKLLEDFPSSKVPSDGLPTLPMNVLKLSINKTFPDGQNNEISSKGPPQKDNLPLSVEKLIPDLSLSDALTNELFLKENLPSLVNDKNIEFPYSTADTKDLPLVVEHLLSPGNDVTPDSLVTDIPSAVPLSTDLEGLQSTNLDKTSDKVLLESTLSKLPRDDLPLTEDKMLPLSDNTPNDLSIPINKTPSFSKLPITKPLLEDVLSDITKGGLSSLVAKALPVTPHSLLDKTLHNFDVKSPLPETKEIPQRPVEKIFPNSEHTDNLIDYLPFSEKPVDTSITDFPSELPLPMHEMHKDKAYIPTDDVEDHDKNETKYLGNPTHDLPIPTDKVSPPKDTTKTTSSSKLTMTKDLLENVLSDINTRGFLLPAAKALPVTPHSLLDKTLHYVDVKSPLSETKQIPQRPVEKIFPNPEHTDNLIDSVPFSEKLVDTSITDFPSELPLPMSEMRKDKPYIPTDDIEDHDNNETQSLGNPTHALPVPIDKVSPAKDTTKTLSSPKLPISKDLLENVLSDINTRGFLLPAAKALPVTPHSLLDKTLHYVDVKSPLSETKQITQRPVEKIFPNPQHTDNLIDYVPFSEKPVDTSNTDFPSELPLPMGEMGKDKPYIPTDDIEDHEKNETQSLGNPTHDLPVPIDKVSTPKDTTKTLSSSKLPKTKALLENVLSDMNTRHFSLPAAQALPVTPHSLLDKTLHYVDVKSPLSETKQIPQRPVERIFPDPEHTDNLIDYVPFSEKPEDISITDFPSELPLPMGETRKDKPYIPTDDVEDHDKNETQSLGNPTHALPVPIDKFSTPKDTTETLSSSKLPISKAFLENVLSDITMRGFSVPVAQSLPVTSPSVLDKTLYYAECPISHITKDSPSLPVDKIPYDHPTDNLAISIDDTLSLPIDKTFFELQSLDIPTELTSPIDAIRPDIPNISMYDKEQDESENPSSENPTDDVKGHDKNETQYLDNPTHDSPVSIDKVSLKDTTKTRSSSKLPITKALLENVLSDMNTRHFSLPAAQALPVTPYSLLDKTLHYVDVKSPLSETKQIPQRPVEKIFPDPEHTDNLIDYVPFSEKPGDISITDFPSELPLPMGETRKDKPYIPTNDVEDHDKNETQSLGNPTHALPVPIDKFSTPKDTTKTLSSSKLPISKALLENVLSDITTRGFSVPVAQSLPVTSPSVLDKTLYYAECPISHITKDSPSLPVDKIPYDHPTDNLAISIDDTLPLPIDKTFFELQSLDIPTELTSPIDDIRPDIPNISMYDKEQDESENPSSENPTDDVEGHDKNESQYLDNSTHDSPVSIDKVYLKDTAKTHFSSKLPITKALLENVLSDMNTRHFSLPAAQALPVTPHSLLDKTLHYVDVKSSLSETKKIPQRPVEKIFPNPEHTDNLIDYVPFSETPVDTSITDFPSELPLPMSEMRKDKPYIPTDDIEDHDKNETQYLGNPTHDLPVPIDKVSPAKDTTKTLSSPKLPITKALLENVLSDITTRGFSVPVAQSLPVTSPSVLDKTLYYVQSPISHITKDNPSLPVDKIPYDHPTDNLPISIKDTLPLPIDKTFFELQSLDIPTELTSPIDDIRPDIPTISMYDKEQDESEHLSSENPTDDVEGHDKNETQYLDNSTYDSPVSIDKVSLKDTTKTHSSSKLPITKALLENVLSDITTRGFSVPVALSLPVTSRSVLDKTLYYVASPISHITKDSPSLPVDKIPYDHPTDNLPISIEDTLSLPIDKTFIELQRSDIPTELTSPIDDIRPVIPNISMYDKEQDESENLSSENLTDDLSSASPMEDILSLSKDTPSDLTLPNNKTPPSSKLPITKVLLENVLSDINTRGFSLPVAKDLPVVPRSQLDKTLYFLESPVSDINEMKSVISTDNLPSSGVNEDVSPTSTDKTLPDKPILDIPADLLVMDKVHNFHILTDNVDQEDKSDILTDDGEDEDKSDILTDDIEDRDKSCQFDQSDNFTDDLEIEDSNESLFFRLSK